MIAGIGSFEYEFTNNIFHPIYPTATWNREVTIPSDDTGIQVTAKISQGMDDAMGRADIEYESAAVGGYFSGDYLEKVVISMFDYAGVSRCIFVGIVPSSKATYSPRRDRIVMTAVDYGLYLTKQTLEVRDLSLLPPDEQIAESSNVAKVLDYDTVTHGFQIGQKVIGSGSNAYGYIVELIQGDGFRRMTLYPASGKFVDDDPLMVGGVQFAQADGRSVDIPWTPYYNTIGPGDWIRSVLGGDNWMRVSGIEPFKIINPAWTSSSVPPAVPMMFGTKEKNWDCIQRMAKYLRYIAVVKKRNRGTLANPDWIPAFYFVPIASIDSGDGLDLPATVTITGPNDPYLAEPIELDQSGEDQVESVRVTCQTLQGVWLESKTCNSKVDYGEGPYMEFYDEPQDICTQVDLDEYCQDMYNLYSSRGCTWNATLMDRPDLELYQKLSISGYDQEIPAGEYRIVHIEYEKGPAVNKTHIKFMLSSSFSSLLKRGRVYTDSIVEIQRVADHQIDKIGSVELGTCVSNDGHTVAYETEAGVGGRGRDSTSTPEIAGVIGVNAKISINHTRGGIVCIPIVGTSGSSTDILTVDAPTITSAVVDPTDANYWILTWTAGANNQHVSINVQTGTYPTTPGTVTGSGSTYKLLPVSTSKVGRLRIRFSGPNATYYIKLWGERNGAYSSTGPTATITSGSGVTPPDTPEEPEPLYVTDFKITDGIAAFPVTETPPTYYHAWTGTVVWNGIDNIYVGGPTTAQGGSNGDIFCDDNIRVTGPNGVYDQNLPGFSHPPLLISNLLKPGINTVTVDLVDWRGVSAELGILYIRSYFR
jgi:hypothetical protein